MPRQWVVPSYIDVSLKSHHTFYANQQDEENKQNPLYFNVARLYDNKALNSFNFADFCYWQQKGHVLLWSEDGLGLCIGDRVVRLQESIEKNLIHYLSTPKQQIDCHEFVEYLVPNLKQILEEPVQYYNPQKKYPVGSVSQVINTYGHPLHSQLYVWEGIFMGKMGEEGDVMFSNAKTQEQLWNGDQTIIYPILQEKQTWNGMRLDLRKSCMNILEYMSK